MCLGLAVFLVMAVDPRITVDAIIQNSVEANERDWKAAPQYAYFETIRNGRGSKTNQVIMIGGSPYERLVKVNGRVLSLDEQEVEQKKLDRAMAERRFQTDRAAAKRVADYERDRQRDHIMIQQLTKAFDFKLIGEERLRGRNVYALRATPRPGYVPPTTEARVLLGMKGELWIDQQSFQWVKVLAQVVSPVNIAGFLATVQPGTYFELEKKPVDGEIWLPAHFTVSSRSKVLKVFRHQTDEDDTFFNYQRTGDSARVSSAKP